MKEEYKGTRHEAYQNWATLYVLTQNVSGQKSANEKYIYKIKELLGHAEQITYGKMDEETSECK